MKPSWSWTRVAEEKEIIGRLATVIGMHWLEQRIPPNKNMFYTLTIITMDEKLFKVFRKRFYNIKTRCYNKNCKSYNAYWWRWIKCERLTTKEFYNDMRESFEKHVIKYWINNTTIDRIDVNWNYCKNNCRWVTRKEQIENKRAVIPVEYKWKKYPSMKSLAEEKWLDHRLVRNRIQRWWSIEKAIDTPAQDRKWIKITWEWKEYKSYRELCRHLWIPKDRLWRWLKHWYTLEEAIIKKTKSFIHNKTH